MSETVDIDGVRLALRRVEERKARRARELKEAREDGRVSLRLYRLKQRVELLLEQEAASLTSHELAQLELMLETLNGLEQMRSRDAGFGRHGQDDA